VVVYEIKILSSYITTENGKNIRGKMKSCLGLLILVLISGCGSLPDHTQYIVTEEGGILRPFAVIEYNVFKDGITAKITLYQKQYLKPSSFPGYMDCEYKELPPEFEKVHKCIVFDTNNFEGDLSLFNIKMVNGKWVAPTIGVRCIGFIKWKTDVGLHYRDWVEGTKHLTKHLVAAYKKDHWRPEEGYEWVLDDKRQVKRDANGDPIVKKIGEN
jgi:hypothetical protein